MTDRPHGDVAAQERTSELERLSQLFDALSQVNQAIVRSTNEAELFATVCSVLIERGGFRMAWIGLHDVETHQIVPVAHCGDVDGYLDGLRIFTDDRPEGRGPIGTAFREQRSYICNDIQADPTTTLWRELAAARDFHASASLLIRQGGTPVAALNVYDTQPGSFQSREVVLLEEAVANLSFALDRFAAERDRQHALQQAAAERLFADTVLDSTPGVIYLYNEARQFLRWNREFLSVTGFTAQEVAGATPLDFFDERDVPRVRESIDAVFASGAASIEAGLRSRDGTITPYFLTGRRVEIDGRRCLLGMGIDIGERVRAEENLRESEERYHSTLESIAEGCQLLSFDWEYLYVNDAAARHGRRPANELLGRRMFDVYPGFENTPSFALLSQCMQERIPLREELEFAYDDGSRAWFELRVQPVPEGVFLLSIDVSDRVRAEQALREAKANLERKVLDRTNELQSALVRAEGADRLKSAFLATMSHELRTPLNSILGFTGILLQELPGPLNAEQTKQLGMVRGSARHLLALINDVLDISKIEAGQLQVRCAPMELAESVERVVESVRPLAAQKGLRIDAPGLEAFPPMVSDRRRVEQILINLLNNAVKFTDRGHIALTVNADSSVRLANDRPAVHLAVTDTGCGIKSGDLSSLFQPFVQLDSGLSRQHEGTGLGLVICRRLTGLLGGEIRVESTWGVGSTFSVLLPIDSGGGQDATQHPPD